MDILSKRPSADNKKHGKKKDEISPYRVKKVKVTEKK
jgi:hypothetical protein